jgi:hypothetical protein
MRSTDLTGSRPRRAESLGREVGKSYMCSVRLLLENSIRKLSDLGTHEDPTSEASFTHSGKIPLEFRLGAIGESTFGLSLEIPTGVQRGSASVNPIGVLGGVSEAADARALLS